MAAVKKLEIKVPDSIDDQYQKTNDEDAHAYQYDRKKNNFYEPNSHKAELFYFDPNTITGSEWKRL